MHPVFLKIGSFELASYGLMTALGYAVASWYLLRYLRKTGMDRDTFWNLIFITFVSAVIGSKLLYILVSWEQLDPASAADKIVYFIRNFRYGFVFYGGLITAVITLAVYLKIKHLPLVRTADFMIVGLPLGHAFGRVGCFLAGCCHGKPTDLPWGVVFTDPHAMVSPELLGVPVHPTQLYEAAGNLLIFLFLHFLSRKPHRGGLVVLAYVTCYSFMRFVIEFFRGDYRGEYILGLSPSQLIALAIAVTAALGWNVLARLERDTYAR